MSQPAKPYRFREWDSQDFRRLEDEGKRAVVIVGVWRNPDDRDALEIGILEFCEDYADALNVLDRMSQDPDIIVMGKPRTLSDDLVASDVVWETMAENL